MHSDNPHKIHIGILSLTPTSLIKTYVEKQEYNVSSNSFKHEEIKSVVEKATFIDENYINFVKLAGMTPIPLLLDDSEEETLEKLESLNGILLTGGAEKLYDDYEFQSETATHYQRRVLFLIDQTKRINESGRFFIVWSICLGYESVLCAENNNKNMLKIVDNQVKTYMPNTVLPESGKTVLGGFLGEDLQLLEEPINYFYHKYGVLLEDFYEFKNLSINMRAISYIGLENGFNVLTCAEYTDYPIYLTLFHPEKIEPAGDAATEEKRLLLQRRLAEFIRVQIQNYHPAHTDVKIREADTILQFPNKYGVRHFYLKNSL